MVMVAVSSAENMDHFEKYVGLIAKLADPRVVPTAEEANAIIADAKPIYWLTGNLHSPETGAAETSMELAYRLAVDENDIPKTIRENMIVLISPSIEPDGHDKHTDWFYKYNKDVTRYEDISRVPFWGKYTYHDNNRDMIAVSQPETANELNAFFKYRPIVVQDNHESIPFLYVSSGTGPYNETYDPSVTSEWNMIAWWEVTRLTSYGMPGVWTHAFWDGWAPNYIFAMANNHNAVGRFYETFGNAIGNTLDREVSGRFGGTEKKWYMPDPPYKKVRWSMRNNVNYQQTGDLSAFYFVATNGEFFLRNFWKRGLKAYEMGNNEPPYAYVIPTGQKDPVDTAYLVNILLKQRIEIHKATADISVKEGSYPAGSYVIRMDQPYRNLVVNLLGIQKYPEDGPRSYDDTGWTLGLHMDVETVTIEDKAIFSSSLVPVTGPVKSAGTVVGGKATGAYVINHGTVNHLLTARMELKDYKALAANAAFNAEGRDFDAGSLIFPISGNDGKIHNAVKSTAEKLGIEVTATSTMPDVTTHDVEVPRVAVFHTWSSTQDDGWVRYAFDQTQVPFDMIHKDHLREGNLESKYDVIILSNARGGSGADIVGGIDPQKWGPLAFVKSDEFKHLGTPASAQDITGGMGIEGVANLQKFVEQGGLLIALHNAVRVPIDYGFVRGITIAQPQGDFYNPGSLFKGEVANAKHPVVYGFDENPTIYRSHSGPLLGVGEGSGYFRAEDKEKQKHIVLKFADEDDLLLSGVIKGKDNIKGKAAVVDMPMGRGHVLLFTFNPFWRDLNHGNYMFVFNAILNYNDLDVGAPAPNSTDTTQD
jgi:hypothetical protein